MRHRPIASAALALLVILTLVAPAAVAAEASEARPAEVPSADGPAPAEEKPAAATPSRAKPYTLRYRLDTRASAGGGMPTEGEVMALEAELAGELGERLQYAVQLPVYTAMRGAGRRMHFGNVYAVYRRRLGEPTLKLGQFVLPFGNLVTYETHTRPIQALYRYSLGARIDAGAEIEGYLGPGAEFQIALTTGSGPFRGDDDGDPVATARVSREFPAGDHDLRLGLSLLRGRLPVFSLMSDPAMEHSHVHARRMKNRVGLDLEYDRGRALLRGEIVGGDDDGRAAYGHWLQVEYPLSYATSLQFGAERWRQFSGGVTGYWAGVERRLTDRRIVRLAAHTARAKEMSERASMTRVTLQFLMER